MTLTHSSHRWIVDFKDGMEWDWGWVMAFPWTVSSKKCWIWNGLLMCIQGQGSGLQYFVLWVVAPATHIYREWSAGFCCTWMCWAVVMSGGCWCNGYMRHLCAALVIHLNPGESPKPKHKLVLGQWTPCCPTSSPQNGGCLDVPECLERHEQYELLHMYACVCKFLYSHECMTLHVVSQVCCILIIPWLSTMSACMAIGWCFSIFLWSPQLLLVSRARRHVYVALPATPINTV